MVEALLVAALLSVTQFEDEEADVAKVAVPVPASAAPSTEEQNVGDASLVSLLDYQIAQVTRTDVASGRTRVSVESNAPAPRSGSFPVRFFIDNTTGPRQVITLRLEGSVSGSRHAVVRAVELNAGERRTVNVPVPAALRYGTVTAEGPGITEHAGASMYFQNTYEPQRVVLSVSRPDQFEKFIGKPPRYSGANVLVHPVPPAEAPDELAAYLGYDGVVVPDATTLDGLDEAQRRALEAYVVTGGRLLVGGEVRSAAMFPMLATIRSGTNDYGFGRLLVATHAPPGGLEVFREGPTVMPRPPPGAGEGRSGSPGGNGLLLPQATAPLGRFLFIIALFTLAIGPGSVWVSRRRGPAALLVTIPATALITCTLIIAYSLIADGFVVHASSYGFTLLDSKQHRAITQGVTAYYANLSPPKATFGPSTMVVGPAEDAREQYMCDLTWKDGLTLGGDFLPSRTYREWGFVSVEPTRARVVVKQKGNAWVVQNALGAPIEKVLVNIDGAWFTAQGIGDGGEGELKAGNHLQYVASVANGRFNVEVPRVVALDELRAHQFLARLEGGGLVPNGGLQVQRNAGEHWVRGEFEE